LVSQPSDKHPDRRARSKQAAWPAPSPVGLAALLRHKLTEGRPMPSRLANRYAYVTLHVPVYEAGRRTSITPVDIVMIGADDRPYEPMRGITIDGARHILSPVAGAGLLVVFHVPETALPGIVELKIPVGAA
jgi:hypothetical protein